MRKLSKMRVLVTGASGFLGRYVVEELKRRSCKEIIAPTSTECDLRNRTEIERVLTLTRPDVVIHLAARVGGIGANQRLPGEFFYDNAIMGIELMEAARKAAVSKFVTIGTVCAYPKDTTVPFKEDDLWNGYPESTNAAYGLAKKMLLVQTQAYRAQYNFPGIYLLPVNLFGPGDNFDPNSSHVIPAMILKFEEARKSNAPSVMVWGSGKASREFLYVEDAARAIVLATEKYEEAEPMNIGSGQEIAIRDLAEAVKKATGYQGAILWDTSKPDGQPRRRLDISRAKAKIDFTAQTDLSVGLKKTVEWFRSCHQKTKKAG